MNSQPALQEQTFFDVIRERRSVRSYDPNVKISREELEQLLAEAVLAPSSSNLQPWRFIVIDSQPLKEKLLPIAYNQKQVTDAAAVIVVLGDLESYRMAETIYSRAVEAGYMTEDVKIGFVERTVKTYSGFSRDVARKIIAIDGGLVSMQLMLAAKARGYDTVPMGGYDAAKLVEALGIEPRYEPIMLIAVGKALNPGRPTARLKVNEVTRWNEESF